MSSPVLTSSKRETDPQRKSDIADSLSEERDGLPVKRKIRSSGSAKKPELRRVAIVDDHPVVWDGLTLMLEVENNLEVQLRARDGAELFLAPNLREIDLLILDISLPRLSGLDIARRLHEEFPRIAILVFTMYDSIDYFRELIGLGVKGYVLKRDPPETLVNAVKNIFAGKLGISPTISPMLLDSDITEFKHRELFDSMQMIFRGLTRREKEVLSMVAGGHSSREIARSLDVKMNTINKHRENIRTKLGSYSFSELIFYVRSNNLV